MQVHLLPILLFPKHVAQYVLTMSLLGKTMGRLILISPRLNRILMLFEGLRKLGEMICHFQGLKVCFKKKNE